VLKQRLITAAVLVPALLWVLLSWPTRYVMVLFAFIVVLGAWEWAALSGFRRPGQRYAYVSLVIALLLLEAWLMYSPGIRLMIFLIALCWWIVVLVWVRRMEAMADVALSRLDVMPWVLGLVGIVVLLPMWLALVVLHDNGTAGVYLMLSLFAIVWGADSGAYFAGHRWGRHKLAPRISPGKTWEGVAGGLVVVVIAMVLAARIMDYDWMNSLSFMLLGIVTALFSIVGDLLESLMKRCSGVKDSGQLLPGHGGVLDRIDSLTAAAPVFVLGLLLQGISL